MKKLIVLLFPLMFGVFTVAQQSATAPARSQTANQVAKEEQATKEDVLELMKVMQSRRNAQAGIDMMAEQMKKGSRAGFLAEYPNASPAVLKKLDGIFDGAMKVVNVDELLPAMVPVYQKYLSHEDAVSITAFYSSPSGRRFLERMPALLKEVGDISSKLVLAHMDEVQAASKKGMEDFQSYVASHPKEVGAPAAAKHSN